MTPADYEFFRKLLKERSGLMLSGEKQYLVESRLQPVARRHGCSNLTDLAHKLKANNEKIIVEVVEAMTTNESFFFRDKIPFDHFRDFMLPTLLESRARQKRIRIWCAAAATGQEPYSLAMIINDLGARVADFRIEIIATDLSTEVLEKARAGIYSQFEVQRGLPIQLLIRHFKQVGEMWQISPQIRSMVQFRQLNLLHDFSHLGTVDIVFCRNVLIYFDQATKIDVLNRIGALMPSDGYLSLGAAETVIGLTTTFRPMTERRGLYAPEKAPKPDMNAKISVFPGRAGRIAAAI